MIFYLVCRRFCSPEKPAEHSVNMRTMNRHFTTVSTGLLLWCLACGLAPAAQVTLAWDAPTHNLDGSVLSDLAGYRIYHGVATGTYGGGQDLGNATQTVLTGLVAGATNFVAVTAYNSVGIESSFSGEITVVTPPVQWHGADYRDTAGNLGADGIIDGIEAHRILIYLRALTYHNEPVSESFPDGYGPGPGTQTTPHPADYRDTAGNPGADWIIDGIEANRILSYQRAGGYAPDAAGVDGYVPTGQQLLGGGSDPSANAQQSATAHYDPGQTLAVTSTLHYTGQLLSLHWRPALPAGYAIAAVSGDGDPELFGGDILWIGALPPSPIQMVYTVQMPLAAVAPQEITSEVTCFLQGQSNPLQAIPVPSLLTVTPADADGDGLPDSWEAHYAGGPAGLEPDADSDGDGASNLEESLAGTAPDDPASVFAMTRLVRTPDGRIAIHWKSAAGRRYAVARATSPGAPFVTQAASITAEAPLNIWRDTPGDEPACFYRVRLAD